MYHISRNGQQSGPYTEEQLRQMAASGQLQPQDLTWRQGDANWRPAAEIPDLFRGQPTMPALPQPNLYGPPAASTQVPNYMGVPVPNYLVQSILVTVLCCLPFGIPAIVYSSQVNSKQTAGDLAGAQESSRKAKFWCWMAFWFGLVPLLLWLVAAVFGSVSFTSSRNF